MAETLAQIPNDSIHKVTFGAEFTKILPEVLDSHNLHRVYAVVSGSLARTTDYPAKLKSLLGSNLVGIREGVSPHSPWDECLQIAESIKKTNADCLVTLGGGSITDAAKVAVLALANDIDTIDGLEPLVDPAKIPMKAPQVPLIFIPTTLSAGEFHAFAGARDPRLGDKVPFRHEGMQPLHIIEDPYLCKDTTPAWVWLSTGILYVYVYIYI